LLSRSYIFGCTPCSMEDRVGCWIPKPALLAPRLILPCAHAFSLLRSQQDDPTPEPTATAGYTLDGRIIKCTATSVQPTTNAGSHLLVVTLTTRPQPASGPEVLTLSFTKPAGDPVKNFAPGIYQLITSTAAGPVTLVAVSNVAALYSSSGGISGGFATSTLPSFSNMYNGFFTDLHP
jgi:hypothetical protein